jgi:hypothetical protein
MAQLPRRSFTDEDPAEVMRANGGAVDMPLMVSFAGYSFAGKSRCALLFAYGASKVVGGEVWAIDTEGGRLREHAGVVPFRRVQLDAPYRSEYYQQAVEHCISKGARVIMIDNMSDEHNGEGGVLEQVEEYLDRVAGDDENARQRHNQAAHKAVKLPGRFKMERYMWKLCMGGVVFVLTYRADEKYKPKTKKERLVDNSREEDLKWSIESTSKLFSGSTLRYLLMPGSDGVPLELDKAANAQERRLMKVGDKFRGVLPAGKPITVEFGEKVARMCRPQALREYTISKGDKSIDKPLTETQAETYRKQGYTVVLSEAERAERALEGAAE